MNSKITNVLISVLFLSSLCYSGITSNPFSYFNVYSLGDIGSSTSSYHSDFQGVAGAGGDVYFSSFSLDGRDNVSDYVLHTGGNANLGGSYKGNLEIGGNLSLGGVSVDGDVYVGGNASNYSGGTLKGNLVAGGQIDFSQQFNVKGQSNSFGSFDYLADHSYLSNYFLEKSQAISAMDDTAALSNQWGGISLTANSGINVVSLSASELKNAWGFTIEAPDDATILINVLGESAELDSTNWNYIGGVSSDNVLLNYADATELNLSGSNIVNILAPNADTNFSSGVVSGSVVVGNLFGGGQVNLGHFNDFESTQAYVVPEPASVLLVGIGGMLFGLSKKFKVINKGR